MADTPIRVLHVFGRLDLGGAESRTVDLLKNIDRTKVQYDFLTHTTDEQYYEKIVKELGARVYSVPRFKGTNLAEYKNAMRRFFAEHKKEWKFVHGHMTSTASIYLPIAKRYGATTIAHSRSAGVDSGVKGEVTKLLQASLAKDGMVDYRFACSPEAAIGVFGKKCYESGRVRVVPNAIDLNAFVFDKAARNRIRAEWQAENRFVIGHIGRFHEPKNHVYLVKIFAELNKLCREKSPEVNPLLVLVGEGSLMERTKEQVRSLGIEDDVLFAGKRGDAAACYQAMDLFLFPSLYEGLPGAVVEAQASGLPCLISSEITKMAAPTELVERMDITRAPVDWAKEILAIITSNAGGDTLRRGEDSMEAVNILRGSGFDAQVQAKRWEKFYTSSGKKKLLLMIPSLAQGGFERVCVETARIMKDEYDVKLLVFDGKNPHFDTEGISVIDIDIPPARGYIGKVINVLRRSGKIKQIKRRYGIDITYSFGGSANLTNALSHVGDLVVTGMRSSVDFDAPDRMQRVLYGSDLMISCSEQMRFMLKKMYGFDRTVVLYNPIDMAKICEQALEEVTDLPFADLSDRSQVICAVGREDKAKGYWHLIKAFSLIAADNDKARLMIIGDGTFEPEHRLIEELSLQDKVVFTGVKKNPFPYVASASLFVLTSNHEGFPNVLVEAMALSKPVIATDCISGPREILLSEEEYQRVQKEHPEGMSIREPMEASFGILVPDMNAVPDYDKAAVSEEDKRLANVIRGMLSDQKRSEAYSARAKERAAHFSVETYKENLRRFLG